MSFSTLLAPPLRPRFQLNHTPPGPFFRGKAVEIDGKIERAEGASEDMAVRLHFRHVNQSQAYQVEEMELRENLCRKTIPAEYTNSPYPLMYYFELRESANRVALYPGFVPNLSNQPYFVIRQARS